MENRAYALAAGLFTLLLGAGIIATALWFSNDTVKTRDYLLVSHHPVTGLNLQAPVRYRGVTVGKVVNIEFDPDDVRNILVRIAVRADTPLTHGVYAQLGSQGVTGLSYVMLDDDGSNPALLSGELARIDVHPSFMDSVTSSGQQMIENFNRVAQRVNVLLDDKNQKQLMATLHQFDRAADGISSLAGNASMTLKRADSVFVEVNDTLPRFNGLLEDVQRSSRGLDRLITEIDEQPHSLLFGKNPPPPGPGERGFSAGLNAQ
ncbi:MAG TPA: MlaD family protein [Burkholderiales bacterium]|nr:MlaD family protein [Burkholderiales bacterium]